MNEAREDQENESIKTDCSFEDMALFYQVNLWELIILFKEFKDIFVFINSDIGRNDNFYNKQTSFVLLIFILYCKIKSAKLKSNKLVLVIVK